MADLKAIMERIPTVARLYYTGLGARRYRRASVMNGPGEPLVHRSHVERELSRLTCELASLRRLADEYDDCIRHMDAGGDFHEFMVERARAFEQAQQGTAGVPRLDQPQQENNRG